MKRTGKLLLIIIVGIISTLVLSRKEDGLKQLALENIEALANNENAREYCVGSGSLDCHGFKVEYIIIYR